jgi:hypothetical protein
MFALVENLPVVSWRYFAYFVATVAAGADSSIPTASFSARILVRCAPKLSFR